MPVTVLDSRDKSWLPSPPRNHRLVRKIQDKRFVPWFKANIGVNAEKSAAGPLSLGLGSQGKPSGGDST